MPDIPAWVILLLALSGAGCLIADAIIRQLRVHKRVREKKTAIRRSLAPEVRRAWAEWHGDRVKKAREEGRRLIDD